MKLNKTQQEVLRFVMGHVDGICSMRAHAMPIVKDSRQWQFAKELESIGVARIVDQGRYFTVESVWLAEWRKEDK